MISCFAGMGSAVPKSGLDRTAPAKLSQSSGSTPNQWPNSDAVPPVIGRLRPSELLAQHRETIRQVVAAHRATNPRVFGSVAHGEDTEASDLDLLVDPQEKMSLFDLGAIIAELNELLGIHVDVVTPNALPERMRERVLHDAMPI